MGSKVWVSFSRIIFQLRAEQIEKYYFIASSFHNIFHLVHSEVHNEAKVPKIIRCTMFFWTCFEEHRHSCTRNHNFSSPELQLIDEIEHVIKRMKRKTYFFVNPSKQKYATKIWFESVRNCPPKIREMVSFEQNLWDLFSK